MKMKLLALATLAASLVLSQTNLAQAGDLTYDEAYTGCYAQKQFEFKSCMILEDNAPSAIYPCLARANKIFTICMYASGY